MLCKTTFTVLIVLRNVLSCVSVVVLTVRSPWWSSIIKRTASSVKVRWGGCFYSQWKKMKMQKYRLAHHLLPGWPKARLGFTEECNGCVLDCLWMGKFLDSISHTVGSVEELVFLQHVYNKNQLRQKIKKKNSGFCLSYLPALKVKHTNPHLGYDEPAFSQSELQPVRLQRTENMISYWASPQHWKRLLLMKNPSRKWPKILSCWTWW